MHENMSRSRRTKRSRDASVSTSLEGPTIISSTPLEEGPRPEVAVRNVEPRRRAARPGQAPPSNNSSVRVRRAATTDADDEDDEFADTIDSDDDHGTRRDEQANAALAVSTSSPSSSWPSRQSLLFTSADHVISYNPTLPCDRNNVVTTTKHI